jgi:hypothetical protein
MRVGWQLETAISPQRPVEGYRLQRIFKKAMVEARQSRGNPQNGKSWCENVKHAADCRFCAIFFANLFNSHRKTADPQLAIGKSGDKNSERQLTESRKVS